jgi:hypothetical protein
VKFSPDTTFAVCCRTRPKQPVHKTIATRQSISTGTRSSGVQCASHSTVGDSRVERYGQYRRQFLAQSTLSLERRFIVELGALRRAWTIRTRSRGCGRRPESGRCSLYRRSGCRPWGDRAQWRGPDRPWRRSGKSWRKTRSVFDRYNIVCEERLAKLWTRSQQGDVVLLRANQ